MTLKCPKCSNDGVCVCVRIELDKLAAEIQKAPIRAQRRSCSGYIYRQSEKKSFKFEW